MPALKPNPCVEYNTAARIGNRFNRPVAGFRRLFFSAAQPRITQPPANRQTVHHLAAAQPLHHTAAGGPTRFFCTASEPRPAQVV
jgi:hypothetical protein